ncbi:murein transglycosylase [Neoasaia chiangmaiensis NBRC 101099]|uniref:Murein transglycosylase n=2 Tax=Neoasaia chiangmaiensis TaxID=320497 RepID=A0A1U9KNW6_9PROT|nr:lytic transglycosylase domain-containing protein [Neoasaia chiangmaiensis]AQS87449.1 murein transglycosylase [Neoasaia chiangmaiensis]GBR42689.1 murein transglycosylase [Neoasaia chiangmaiensis NBRC 101099]GEN16226.1 hypothetical protein NCH01_26570 [Neoasaia chiangmaiensis]
MRHDKGRFPAIGRAVLAMGAAGGLAACATTQGSSPQVPVVQEAASYRAHAKNYYAPPGSSSDPWGPYIEEASQRFDVPGTWIRAVMMQESGGRLFDKNGQFVTSIPGAMGLMQLMPPAYDDMRAQYGLGDDPYDPHDNILAGTAYIRQMYDIYGSPGFLAAYNDGPGNLDAYLRRGRPLPRETRRYVASIGPQLVGSWPSNRSQADLMVASHDPNAPDPVMVAQNTAEATAVRAAWRQHDRSEPSSDDNDDQPVQVAEAPATAATPAPAYTRNWNAASSGGAQSSSVSAAWAARGISAPKPAPASSPIQMASAQPSASPSPTSVSQAWASRTVAEPIPAAPTLSAQPVLARVTQPPSATLPAQHRMSFHLITPAMAEPLPTVQRATPVLPHNWSIQVGAYKSAALAQSAVSQAHSHAQMQLASARTFVAPVDAGHAHLYRARLTGLSHDDAIAACRRLGGHTAPCVVVSPTGF